MSKLDEAAEKYFSEESAASSPLIDFKAGALWLIEQAKDLASPQCSGHNESDDAVWIFQLEKLVGLKIGKAR